MEGTRTYVRTSDIDSRLTANGSVVAYYIMDGKSHVDQWLATSRMLESTWIGKRAEQSRAEQSREMAVAATCDDLARLRGNLN